MKNGFVYIMTNYNRNVLYVGVTSNLVDRVLDHRAGIIKGFTNTYKCKYLIYYEEMGSIILAIEREKQLKRWHRSWKFNLIKSQNPGLNDLTPQIIDLNTLRAFDELNN